MGNSTKAASSRQQFQMVSNHIASVAAYAVAMDAREDLRKEDLRINGLKGNLVKTVKSNLTGESVEVISDSKIAKEKANMLWAETKAYCSAFPKAERNAMKYSIMHKLAEQLALAGGIYKLVASYINNSCGNMHVSNEVIWTVQTKGWFQVTLKDCLK